MKSKRKYKLLGRTVAFIITLILMICIMAIGLFYYIFSIPEPYGISITDFPKNFTNSYTVWTTYENGKLTIEEKGLKRLDEYGLWIQFIDENGEEIFSHNKPENFPTKYTAAELLALTTSYYENGYTLFVNILDDTDKECSYIVGFPYDIGKYMLYYNGSRISRLSPAAKLLTMVGFGILMIFIFAYSVWLSRKLSKVTKGISGISHRTYTPLKENGIFSEVYQELNKMYFDIRHADKVNEDTERVRREWITNITHDLKTPLSPIKGYAELLTDSSNLTGETSKEYGEIILRNVNHTEKLINDLKMTYQLDSGAFAYSPKETQLTRFIRELVIDIVNDPAFSNRNIEFESNTDECIVLIDPDLFRRAIQNIIINALTHNPPETKVLISTRIDVQSNVHISICDNGVGISEDELPELFSRYYRGTSTKEKSEGSGLGLAIAKQIIELHGGNITVSSKRGKGTKFEISIPEQRK